MMSHLYFNEKSDYLKEKMKSFALPQKETQHMSQLLIYYIQYENRKS